MNYPTVSIVLSFFNRPNLLRRTFASWSNLDYPGDYEFVVADNGSLQPDEMKEIVGTLKAPRVKFMRIGDTPVNVNIVWNTAYKETQFDFVVFAMQDEIISNKQILQHMIDSYQGKRISVATLFLNQEMTDAIDSVDWQHNAELIETLPGFWTDTSANNSNRQDASLLSHVSGQYRKEWEYLGLFRPDPLGYLWLDQDIHLREACLGRIAETAKGVKLYHQAHAIPIFTQSPGYIYCTEREARLIDPAKHP